MVDDIFAIGIFMHKFILHTTECICKNVRKMPLRDVGLEISDQFERNQKHDKNDWTHDACEATFFIYSIKLIIVDVFLFEQFVQSS